MSLVTKTSISLETALFRRAKLVAKKESREFSNLVAVALGAYITAQPTEDSELVRLHEMARQAAAAGLSAVDVLVKAVAGKKRRVSQ